MEPGCQTPFWAQKNEESRQTSLVGILFSLLAFQFLVAKLGHFFKTGNFFAEKFPNRLEKGNFVDSLSHVFHLLTQTMNFE